MSPEQLDSSRLPSASGASTSSAAVGGEAQAETLARAADGHEMQSRIAGEFTKAVRGSFEDARIGRIHLDAT
jgi:hypothetical protein